LKALQIVASCTSAAIVYGILHDLVTTRICLEYFTIGHPRILQTESPLRLALAWGVLASWWVGMILGWVWALSGRVGPQPKLEPRAFTKPLVLVMGVSALAAFFVGILGHELAVNHIVVLQGAIADAVPADRHVAFITCLWAHGASYLAATLAGLFVAVWAWRARGRLAQPS
jgi:hypothetical protein